MREDFYELLDVQREADAAELKKAYRKQAMRFHPDRNPGDSEAEERFKAVSAAYEVLSDENRRAIYDRYGHEGLENQGMGGGFSDASDIFSNFGDLFGDLFGFGGQRAVRRGSDLRLGIQISLRDCFNGLKRDLEIPRSILCSGCDGSGAAKGTSPVSCGTCRGRGQVAVNRGFVSMTTTCPACRGRGQSIASPCKTCRGGGTEVIHDTVSVDIPPGVDDGMKLRLTGKGEGGPPGGEPGDLYVIIHTEQDPDFQRAGDDLQAALSIDMVSAALGTTLEFETLDGVVKVDVRAGSQPNRVIRLPGKGMPSVSNPKRRGDLHLVLDVVVPTSLSTAQKGFLKQFRDA
jgi:molecular chaperone DnaJ